MTESTISPSPIRIRKAHRDGGDWLYIYLRSNVSQRTEVDEVSGEQTVMYEYNDVHIRVPLPAEANVDVPAGHSANQDALKAQLKRLCIDNATFRQSLADALTEAQIVDWRDRVSEWTGEASVELGTDQNWLHWTPGEPVSVGDRRIYGGVKYECQQAHTTQGHWTPDITLALWVVVPEGIDWTAGARYEVGDVVTYEGAEYECVQSHTAQADWTPPATPALWSVVEEPGDEIQPWVQPTGAHDAYQKGDRVTYNGWIWESTIDANVWEPGVYGWSQVEPL